MEAEYLNYSAFGPHRFWAAASFVWYIRVFLSGGGRRDEVVGNRRCDDTILVIFRDVCAGLWKMSGTEWWER